VRRVLPGETVSVRADGTVRSRRYFSPEPKDEWRFRSEDECAKAFREVFEAAVQCRLRSTGRPALLMSGGLDSAAVAAAWYRSCPEKRQAGIPVLSMVSDDVSECIESQCILELVERLGLESSIVRAPSMSGCASIEDLDSAFFDFPHPVSHSLLLQGVLSRVARRDGSRVLLHGVNGDLAMHVPHDYLAWFFRRGQWWQGIHECVGAGRNHTYLKGFSAPYLFIRGMWQHVSTPSTRRLVNRLRGKRAGSVLTDSLIGSALAQRVGLESRLAVARSNGSAVRGGIQRDHLEVLFPAGAMVGLEGYDRVAGTQGIELRDPWSDMRVLEFFTRLPLHYKVRQGWLKPVVRDVYGQILGKKVSMRKDKEHVGWRLYDRFVDRHQRTMSKKLRDAGDPLRRYVDITALSGALDRYESSRSYEDAISCYSAFGLLTWLERLGKT
jgi:asparagine synthase (glutamine-hydrolysing)